MHYSGSKANIASSLLYYMLRNRNGRPYVEPFLGGANVMCNVPPEQGTRIGSDYNHYIIALWKALQEGWQPPLFVTREEHDYVVNNEQFLPQHIVGYIRTACKFNGYWSSGYMGVVKHTRDGHKEALQNHQNSSRAHIMRQVPNMKDVILRSGSYDTIEIPDNSLIYCDPPYLNVSYNYLPSGFSHDRFWQWCREKVQEDHLVFITEYVAPSDFTSIWTENVVVERGQIHGGKETNKLFVHESQVAGLDLTKPVSTIPKIKIPVKGVSTHHER